MEKLLIVVIVLIVLLGIQSQNAVESCVENGNTLEMCEAGLK